MISLVDSLLTRKYAGKKAFLERLNLFKLGLSIALIVLNNILQYSSVASNTNTLYESVYWTWCILSLLKVVSVHNLLTFSDEYNLIFSTFTQIIPLMKDLFVMMFSITFIYSVVGTFLLGGQVSTESEGLYQAKLGEKLEDNFFYLSFNDVPNSFLFLYCIMMNNDWSKISTMAMLAFNNKDVVKEGEASDWVMVAICRFYFFTYYFLGFMVVLNIIIGSIIDFIVCYLTLLDIKREKEKEAKKE